MLFAGNVISVEENPTITEHVRVTAIGIIPCVPYNQYVVPSEVHEQNDMTRGFRFEAGGERQ